MKSALYCEKMIGRPISRWSTALIKIKNKTKKKHGNSVRGYYLFYYYWAYSSMFWMWYGKLTFHMLLFEEKDYQWVL